MIDVLRGGITVDSLIYILAFIVAIVFSISAHEFSHAYVAYKQGDMSAKSLGRLTLNPIAHFDIFGFLSLLIFGFGWAKPVPINPLKFKEYRKGIFLTSIAGIVANIFIAFFSAGVYVLLGHIVVEVGTAGYYILNFFVQLFYILTIININLAVFNLLPIAPLDGFNLICSLSKTKNKFIVFMERYGSILLLVLVLTSAVSYILGYATNFIATPFIDFWKWVI